MRSDPAVACSIIVTMRARVDLPQPDSPTTAKVRPREQLEGGAVERLQDGDVPEQTARQMVVALKIGGGEHRRFVHSAASRPGWSSGTPATSG